ncbi:hypothetical protein ACFW04_010013 [Cataglyphis niger]
MSHSRKKCVVLGCKSETLRLRSFPSAKDKERFLKWLKACRNIKLLQLSVPQLRHRVVCDEHFEARVKLATTLSRVAVPTLHLPKPIDASNYKFIDAQTSDARKINVQMTEKKSTNDEIFKILTELSESDVRGSEDEISEEEHTLDVEQRHSDVEEDAAILSDSSYPNDKVAFNDSTETVYVGRNNITTWNKLPCTNQSVTLFTFRKIFDDRMLEEIVACINFSNKHRVYSSHKNIKETTRAEMLAVIGLLYLGYEERHASLLELWTDNGTGFRFLFLLDCLQLDDRNTRAINIWNKFVENCKKSYLPSDFIQHVPNKPAHNGLKISLVDVKTSYTCNMELYCGQQPEGLYRVSNDPAAIVHNLSCDEHYISYLLAVSLLTDKITFLVGRTRMGFRNDAILESYVDGDYQFDEQEFSKKRSRETDEENLLRRKDRCFMCGLRKGMITVQKCNICSRFTYKRHIAYI